MATIWIVKHNISPPSLPGGVRQNDFAKGLAKRGHDVYLFASGFNHALRKSIRDFTYNSYVVEPAEGFQMVWMKGFPYYWNDWRRALDAVSVAGRFVRVCGDILANGARKPEVILANSVPLFLPLSAWFVSRRLGARFCLEVADIWPRCIADMGLMSVRSPAYKMLETIERFLYRRARTIISPLPKFGDHLANIGLQPKAVTIDRSVNLAPQNCPARADVEGFHLFYCGAHGPVNDLVLAIKVFAELQRRNIKTIKLTMIGDGIEKPRLVEESRRLGLQNIEFREPVANSEVPYALGGADALLWIDKELPVHRYGHYPNKVADYMAVGRPIVRLGQHHKSLIDEVGCGVTLGSADPLTLADSLIGLANLPKCSLDEMGRRGRSYAEQNLSLTKNCETLAKVLGIE